MPTLHVTLVQKASSLRPEENRAGVRQTMDELEGRLSGPEGLVVFPEVFARDFGKSGSDISQYAESLDGPFVQQLRDCADEGSTTLVAGMFESSDDPARPYNTLVVAGPGRLVATYRKIHLYDSFGYRESDRLLAGELDPKVVEIGDVAVGLMTCYDLRFPELARELTARGAQVLVVPAAWVAGPLKVDHWRTLLRARAIENTVYVVAAGQPGPRYTGHSMVVDPRGAVLAEAGEGEEVIAAAVDTDLVAEARAENPSLANRRF